MRYRYHTPDLTGPWRASYKEAERDALVAGQARGAPDTDRVELRLGVFIENDGDAFPRRLD
jgi:hypothetical protein